jgi:anti-anti-sigma regulatory factor
MKRTTVAYDTDSTDAFEREVLSALNHGHHVVVNLDYVPTLGMGDVRRLIKLLRKTRDIGTDFALHTARPDLRNILAVTALDAVFTVVESDAA